MKIPKTVEEVEQMSRLELCRLWRFAPAGAFWRRGDPVSDAAEKRLETFGGFSAEISKQIGLDH